MVSRNDILGKACDDCMKELYTLVEPHVEWDDFVKENKLYTEKYNEWENKMNNKEIKISRKEYCGPAPYEFYYLPREIMKNVCDSYVHAYRMDQQQELLDTIEILKNYCKEPIVDKYIEEKVDENGFRHPGYRGYDNPDNLRKEITKIISNYTSEIVTEDSKSVEEIQNKFFEFLDMAGKFFNYNRELNSFSMTVYLGPSPNSNKEAVIENWKQYRNKDIEIDENKMKSKYFEDEFDTE